MTPTTRLTHHARLLSTAALVLAVLGGVLLSPSGAAARTLRPSSVAAPAAADDPKRVGFGVVPATATGIDQRAFFSYGLAPGATAYDRVAVVNYSAAPLALGVQAADALNSAEGGFALQASADRPMDLGAWITIDKAKGPVTVPGRSADGKPGTRILPVRIAIPKNASPGDHGAGIVAVLSTVGKNPNGQNVRLEQRVATRVYVKVAGPVRPALTVAELSADYSPGRWPWQAGTVTMRYAVVNSGNVRMGYDPTLRIAGIAGLGGRTVELDPVAELLPHNSQNLTTRIEGVWPLGWMSARVTATPQAAMASPAPDIAQVSRSTTVWALSWWLALLLVVIGGLLARVIVRRRRRTSGQGSMRPTPTPTPTRSRGRVGAGV